MPDPKEPKRPLSEFKQFILRGSVIDLAVGVVIGAAFGAIVTTLVKDIVTPLLSLLHLPDFSQAVVHVGHQKVGGRIVARATVRYGEVVNAAISFFVISAFIFFFVVKPLNRLLGRGATEDEPKNRECPHCLSSIPIEAGVCAYCTRDVVEPKKPSAHG